MRRPQDRQAPRFGMRQEAARRLAAASVGGGARSAKAAELRLETVLVAAGEIARLLDHPVAGEAALERPEPVFEDRHFVGAESRDLVEADEIGRASCRERVCQYV